MDTIFQKIPFLRITLAFAIGIIIGSYFEFNRVVLAFGAVLALLILLILNRKYSFKIEPIFGIVIPLFFILLGASTYLYYNWSPSFFTQGISVGTVLEKPQEKENSYKSLLLLNGVNSNDSTFRTKEKVLVYFEKEKHAKDLNAGDVVLINIPPKEINNFGSPYGFDYKNYLKNKRIYRQLYLNENNWQLTSKKSKTLLIRAELLREQLLTIYRKQNLGANETEILSALTLGYKRNLDSETKRIFSAAGAMHVLAVSGLHVGIIFMVFAYLFGFLRKQKTGKYIFVVAAILLLWFYAFITGLSPSVLRASTMFSIVIIGTNINRKASIYNSLAASAMFLLLINPNNLFEVGFQLSYSAVFGIVFLQPKIAKIWTIKNKIGLFFWNLITVSIAAQISTFPLAAYYFNQFPIYFWITNLVVIPAVMILIPLGIVLLLSAKIPFLSFCVAFLLKLIIKNVYLLLVWIESLPYSVLNVSLYKVELAFLITFLFFSLLFINNKRTTYFKLAFTFFIILSTTVFTHNFRQYRTSELIVFNNTSNPTIQLITGYKNYVVSKQPITENDYLFHQIQEVQRKKRLSTPSFHLQKQFYEDKNLLIKNNYIFFEGKTISHTEHNTEAPSEIKPDFHIGSQNFKYKKQAVNSKTLYICTSYLNSKKTEHKTHSLKTDGVFNKKWKRKNKPPILPSFVQ